MRIHLESGTGLAFFPGLQVSIDLDTKALSPGQSSRLVDAVQRSDFFRRAAPAVAPGAADQTTYRITVDDESGKARTLTLTVPVEDADLRDLIAIVESLRSA